MSNTRGSLPVPEGRRLERGVMPAKSKYANNDPNSARNEGKRLAELEAARTKLGVVIEQYAKGLLDKTVPENRSEQDREKQKNVIDALPGLASELDFRNATEGTLSLIQTLLNSVVVLRDQQNKLRYQNYFINQKHEALREEFEALKKLVSHVGKAETDGKSGTGELASQSVRTGSGPEATV